jgi:hypothetical protein
MGKHCEACRIESSDCLCNTCKKDDLYRVPACCTYSAARTFDEDDICSGIKDCKFYEKEANTDEA